MNEYIVDLHIHSKYAYATSKDMNLAEIDYWAQRKGIDVIGTGDFTHPEYFKELTSQLEEADGGLYTLTSNLRKTNIRPVYFVPTVEIATIYKRHDVVRKIHTVFVLETLEKVAELNKRLANNYLVTTSDSFL